MQSGGAHYAESLPQEYQPDAEYLQLYRAALAGSAAPAGAGRRHRHRAGAGRARPRRRAGLAGPGRHPGRRPAAPLGRRPARRSTCRTTRCRSCAAAASTRWRCATSPSTTTRRGSCSSTAGPARARSPGSWPPRWPSARRRLRPRPRRARRPGPVRIHLRHPRRLADPVGLPELDGVGLVSRTVLNPRLLRPDQYHGAKFYAELAPADVSNDFLDAVTAEFAAVSRHRPAGRPGTATGPAGRPSSGSSTSTASATATWSSPASARRPGCCCAGCRGGCWCARTPRPATWRTCGCSRSGAGCRSRRWPSCPTAASA